MSREVLPTLFFDLNSLSIKMGYDSEGFVLHNPNSRQRWNTFLQIVQSLWLDSYYELILFASVKREFQSG